MQKSIPNKQGKFGVKILWRYTDMAIFVLRCFILTHPVQYQPAPLIQRFLIMALYKFIYLLYLLNFVVGNLRLSVGKFQLSDASHHRHFSPTMLLVYAFVACPGCNV